MKTKPKTTESNVHDEFQNLLADIEDLIKGAGALAGEDMGHVRDALNARIHAAKESVDGMGGTIADQARDTAKATNDYVHENPWQAIAIGAAVGLLIGIAVSRR